MLAACMQAFIASGAHHYPRETNLEEVPVDCHLTSIQPHQSVKDVAVRRVSSSRTQKPTAHVLVGGRTERHCTAARRTTTRNETTRKKK